MKQPINLSKEDIDHILAVYADNGMKCLPVLAEQYKISRSFIRALAMAHRVAVKKPHGGGYNTHKDKRWAWAKARGAVVA